MAEVMLSSLSSVVAKVTEEKGRIFVDETAETRLNLTSPTDEENELIKVAALHGPPGICAVLRARKDYSWFVLLGLRAIEVCLGPRPSTMSYVNECDTVSFSMQMLEMEMIDEIFVLMRQYEHLKDIQSRGLAVIELLVMDDSHWRDEVARKGGVRLLCEVARQRRDFPNIMCQVVTCMSYLAAEDYVEVMLCQHEALEYIGYIFHHYSNNAELITRSSLALLNLTCCEPHVEEFMDKGALPLLVKVLNLYKNDVNEVIILCGVLANMSVNEEARQLLVEDGIFKSILQCMQLEPHNIVLQIACIKALVNYSTNAEHYMLMEELQIPNQIGQIMVDHGADAGLQKYGNMFLGQHTSCTIL
jgi:hypothetical protein